MALGEARRGEEGLRCKGESVAEVGEPKAVPALGPEVKRGGRGEDKEREDFGRKGEGGGSTRDGREAVDRPMGPSRRW